MIDEDQKSISVKVYKLNGAGDRVFMHDAEIVPYTNAITKERDPLIRQLRYPACYLHLSTILKNYKGYVYEGEDGGTFDPEDVVAILYDDEEGCGLEDDKEGGYDPY